MLGKKRIGIHLTLKLSSSKQTVMCVCSVRLFVLYSLSLSLSLSLFDPIYLLLYLCPSVAIPMAHSLSIFHCLFPRTHVTSVHVSVISEYPPEYAGPLYRNFLLLGVSHFSHPFPPPSTPSPFPLSTLPQCNHHIIDTKNTSHLFYENLS